MHGLKPGRVIALAFAALRWHGCVAEIARGNLGGGAPQGVTLSRFELAAHRAEREPAVAPAFIRIADVLRITALSRATLYRRIADGKFPKPVHLGGRACGWPLHALQAWIDDPQGYNAPRPPASAAPLRQPISGAG